MRQSRGARLVGLVLFLAAAVLGGAHCRVISNPRYCDADKPCTPPGFCFIEQNRCLAPDPLDCRQVPCGPSLPICDKETGRCGPCDSSVPGACAAFPALRHCSPSGACAECNVDAHCGDSGGVCRDYHCRPCAVDGDCADGLCSAGRCIPVRRVLFVDNGEVKPEDCPGKAMGHTGASPMDALCSIQDALDRVDQMRDFIRVAARMTPYGGFDVSRVAGDVTIAGFATRGDAGRVESPMVRQAPGSALTKTGGAGTVVVREMSLSALDSVVNCTTTDGRIEIQGCTIEGSFTGQGIHAEPCHVRVSRSRIAGNFNGALYSTGSISMDGTTIWGNGNVYNRSVPVEIAGGELRITNCFIVANSCQPQAPAIRFGKNVQGQFAFNTVVENHDCAGIACHSDIPAWASIVTWNSTPKEPVCNWRGGSVYNGSTLTPVALQGSPDAGVYRLPSDAGVLGRAFPPDGGPDGAFDHDFEDDPRPCSTDDGHPGYDPGADQVCP